MFKYFFENYKSLILESFKTAEAVFSRTNNPEDVKKIIQKFKELAQQGKFTGAEKDINHWVKKSFSDFKHAVNVAERTQSNKSQKKFKKSSSVKLKELGNWIAIAPLSKEASCYYGSGTAWCTAATQSKNYFDQYFNSNINLIYLINKMNGEKFAIAKNPKNKTIEAFDDRDNSIVNMKEIIDVTGMDPWQLFDQLEKHEAPTTARKSALEKEDAETQKIEAEANIKNLINLDPEQLEQKRSYLVSKFDSIRHFEDRRRITNMFVDNVDYIKRVNFIWEQFIHCYNKLKEYLPNPSEESYAAIDNYYSYIQDDYYDLIDYSKNEDYGLPDAYLQFLKKHQKEIQTTLANARKIYKRYSDEA